MNNVSSNLDNAAATGQSDIGDIDGVLPLGSLEPLVEALSLEEPSNEEQNSCQL